MPEIYTFNLLNQLGDLGEKQLSVFGSSGGGGGGAKSRLGVSVTTQGGSGRQFVTGPGRNIFKYRFVLLNAYRFGRLKTK